MEAHRATPHHRKRKRRRLSSQLAIAAQLFLDPALSGDGAALSEDLLIELFPGLDQEKETDGVQPIHDQYLAITPKAPATYPRPSSANWTILPIQQSRGKVTPTERLRSCVRVSPSSTLLGRLLEQVVEANPSRPPTTIRDNIEIFILDVVPLPLETVFVGVERAVLLAFDRARQNSADNVKSVVPRRRSSDWKSRSSRTEDLSELDQKSVSSHLPDQSLISTIRLTLGSPKLVHSGAVLPIIQQRSAMKSDTLAKIEFCEPVSQGLLLPTTKIVVVPQSGRRSNQASIPARPLTTQSSSSSDDEDEENSNEQFYSAGEDYSQSPLPVKRTINQKHVPIDQSSADNSDQEQSLDLSESDTEAIGLNLPSLPNVISDGGSEVSTVTPRTLLSHNHSASSPGSFFSEQSTSTVRSARPAFVFRTYGLTSHVPDGVLHPAPLADDDDEARVLVDAALLAKIGCFSGDWVRIQSISEDLSNNRVSWGVGPFNSPDQESVEWRAAKAYGISAANSFHYRRSIGKSIHHKSISMNGSSRSTESKIYLSPLLLANLGSPEAVHLSPLCQSSNRTGLPDRRPHSASVSTISPPLAKEVEIYKLATPLATERNLQPSLFQALRSYFESKQRLVKTGDLIAIPFNAQLGKAVYTSAAGEEEVEFDEMNHASESRRQEAINESTDVAWFKIGPMTVDSHKSENNVDRSGLWGDMAVIKPLVTRMSQKGSEIGKVLSTANNTWPYYLGLKRFARGQSQKTEGLVRPPVSYTSSARRRIRELASAATSPQAVHFKLPPVAVLLSSTQRHIGKATTAWNACSDLGLHVFEIDAFDILSEGGSTGGDVNTAGLLEARAERAMTCGSQFTALLIRHIDVLTAERMATTLRSIIESSRVFLATTSNLEKVPETIRGLFTHEIEMTAPDEGEREGILRDIISASGIELSPDVDLASVAVKTAALVASDLADVVERAAVAREERLEALAASANPTTVQHHARVLVRDIVVAGGFASRCVTKADFDTAVDAGRKNFADAIGAPKIPNVSWDDVGGLTNVKDAVMETIQLPLERPELFAKGMKKRSGILFYGPPGTGKTLLAKAIATEFSLNFFSVKGPELLNMYIGESEANVRRVFQRARDARPCVVFFDELDSVAPKRGNQGDSGGVMDRIVSQLLAELDGMSNGEEGNGGGVFVIGATNRPDLLDQALLRPGRFDKMLYLGVSDTHEKQLTILEALTRKFTLNPRLSLQTVASSLPFTYTGADLYALCSDAMLKAITRRASAVDEKVRKINIDRAASSPPRNAISVAHFFDHFAQPEDTLVMVELEDFEQAVRELVPSVSVGELEHYNGVRRTFEMAETKKTVARNRPDTGRRTKVAPRSISASNGLDDDFVLKTGALTLNGTTESTDEGVDKVSTRMGNGHTIVSGKGKGKMKATNGDAHDIDGFGDAAAGDEAMYDD